MCVRAYFSETECIKRKITLNLVFDSYYKEMTKYCDKWSILSSKVLFSAISFQCLYVEIYTKIGPIKMNYLAVHMFKRNVAPDPFLPLSSTKALVRPLC